MQSLLTLIAVIGFFGAAVILDDIHTKNIAKLQQPPTTMEKETTMLESYTEIADRNVNNALHHLWEYNDHAEVNNNEIQGSLDMISNTVLARVIQCRHSRLREETKQAARDEALARLLSQ